jgi:hypothetical protein
MQRFALIAVALVALIVPANARATLVLVFDQPTAAPNDRVIVRIAGTPTDFGLEQRVKPLQRPVRIYVVRADVAGEIRSRLDRRLIFIGLVVPDRNGRGLMTFSTPPLDSGAYVLAYWQGRTLVVQQLTQLVQRYRSRTLLRIETTESCPVTLPNASRPSGQPRLASWYGNGLLWAGLTTDGVYAVPPDRVEADGSIFNKLPWVTTPSWRAPTVSGLRLDATAPPLHVLAVNSGSFSGAANPSYMSAVTFPTTGCWRVTARVDDVSLSYVVEVVVRPAATP